MRHGPHQLIGPRLGSSPILNFAVFIFFSRNSCPARDALFRAFVVRPDLITLGGWGNHAFFRRHACFQIADRFLAFRLVTFLPFQAVLYLFVDGFALEVWKDPSAVKLVLYVIIGAPFFTACLQRLCQVSAFPTAAPCVLQALSVDLGFILTGRHWMPSLLVIVFGALFIQPSGLNLDVVGYYL
jgi:hypothetical protein